MLRTGGVLAVFFCALAALVGQSGAAEYYVSTAAGDTGTGGPDHLFRTLAQAAKKARKGDTIYLVRGQVYRESDVSVDGATIAAAGPADLAAPVLTGATAVTGFKPTPENSKILSAACPQKPVMCAVHGQLLTLARFPNEGFLSTQKGTTVDTIVDEELARRASTQRWSGAQLHWRKWSWWWETRTVTGDDGKGLQLSPTPVKDLANLIGIGSAYFIDDCRAELDAPGEWWYDSATKQLLVIPPTGVAAANLVVEAACGKDGIHLSNATLRGITFRHYTGTAVHLSRTSTVEDCNIEQIWDCGISANWDAPGSVVRRCVISDVLNGGIRWNENGDGPGGSVIEHNRLERIGMRDGLGGSGTWHSSGIVVTNGKAVTIRQNTMVDVGYCGVILGKDGQIVERNVLVRCMSTMNDGAAIYANCSNSVIRENIILNAVGNLWTSQPFYPLGHGIWPEFLSQFHDSKIIGNTVVGCGGNGVFMPNNFTCEIRENVLAGNRLAGLKMGLSNNIKKPQQHTITGNVFVEDTRMFPHPLQKEHIPSDWMGNDKQSGVAFEKGVDYGKMSGSVFVTAPGTSVASGFKDAAAWKNEAAWADPAPKVVPAQAMLLINDTDQAIEFPLPSGSWVSLSGEHLGSAVHVETFRSAVILANGPLAPNAPVFVLASGRDFTPGADPAKVAKKVAGVKLVSASSAEPRGESKAKDEVPASEAPKPDALAAFLKKLKEHAITAVGERRYPRFIYSRMKADVQLTGIDGNRASLLYQGSSITADFFEKLDLSDALALSRGLLREDNLEEHALAAFFARCVGKREYANEQMGLAGAAGTEVKAAFSR